MHWIDRLVLQLELTLPIPSGGFQPCQPICSNYRTGGKSQTIYMMMMILHHNQLSRSGNMSGEVVCSEKREIFSHSNSERVTKMAKKEHR